MPDEEKPIPDEPRAENAAPVKREFSTTIVRSTRISQDPQRATIITPDQPETMTSYSHEEELPEVALRRSEKDASLRDTASDEELAENASHVGSEDDATTEVTNEQTRPIPAINQCQLKRVSHCVMLNWLFHYSW